MHHASRADLEGAYNFPRRGEFKGACIRLRRCYEGRLYTPKSVKKYGSKLHICYMTRWHKGRVLFERLSVSERRGKLQASSEAENAE
jgi:hypothetical protein